MVRHMVLVHVFGGSNPPGPTIFMPQSWHSFLGCRLMVGQRILVPYVRVQLLPPQPKLNPSRVKLNPTRVSEFNLRNCNLNQTISFNDLLIVQKLEKLKCFSGTLFPRKLTCLFYSLVFHSRPNIIICQHFL